MDDLARQMHQGKIKPGNISKDFVLNTYKELYKGAKSGYGSNWKKFDGNEGRTITSLKKNIFLFSGAKTYAMQRDLNELMTKDGKILPFDEFKKEALKLNEQYNKNYLQAEYQTARQTAHQVEKWQDYQKDKDIFPNLKYMTTGDDRVRDSHRKLDGIVKPIDSTFWNSFYPPNGWRCRCYVSQTAEPTSKQEYPPEKALELGVQKGFNFNAAKTGEVFNSEMHPYFAMASVSGKTLRREMELMKLEAPLETRHVAENGAKVRVSPFTDTRPDELIGNYRTAIPIANDLNKDVDLIAYLDGEIILNRSNLDYEINGVLADRKSPKGKNLRNVLKRAVDQGAKIVVIDMHNNNIGFDDMVDIAKKRMSGKAFPSIREIIVVDKKRNKAESIPRKK